MLLLCGCSQQWDRLKPGSEGVVVAPVDNRNGQDLAKGLVAGHDLPTLDPHGMGARFLRIGQLVRAVADDPSSPVDDRGRKVEVLVLDGPHNGLHLLIRRDQFTPRRSD
jgi:hypothetical protein